MNYIILEAEYFFPLVVCKTHLPTDETVEGRVDAPCDICHKQQRNTGT